MGKYIDLTGMQFGKWYVKERDNDASGVRWICQCECGTIRSVITAHLKNGASQSCGCVQKEICSKRMTKLNTTHNLSKTKLYQIWIGIKQRCYDKNCLNYKYYGSRGTKVCKEWLDKENGFTNFYDWAISNGWKDEKRLNGRCKWTIDRIDNNGDYEPSNCKWSTLEEQAVNTTRNHFVTFENKTLTLSQWARLKNIKYYLLIERLGRNWSFKDALYKPVRKTKRNCVSEI